MKKKQYEQQMNDYFETISTLVLNNRYLYRNTDKFNFDVKERLIKQTSILNSTMTLLGIKNEMFISFIDKKTLLKFISEEQVKWNELSAWLELNYLEHEKNIDEVLTQIQEQETEAVKECERFMNIHFNEIMEVSEKIKLNLKNEIYVLKLRNILEINFDLFILNINAFVIGVTDEQKEKVKSLLSEIQYLNKWIEINILDK